MASLNFFNLSVLRQNFPGKPTFTEKDIPDLSKKVYIVTGANAGVGKETTRLLYAAHASVYLACRSESKARQAIADIQAAVPASAGQLAFLHLDLADLATIKPAVDTFCALEDRLDVLFNNAGVMLPPADVRTAQGYDMQLGTNCLGPLLFTELLTPLLRKTAAARKSSEQGSVRVVWVASMATEVYSVKRGVDMSNLVGGSNDTDHNKNNKNNNGNSKDYIRIPSDPMTLYGISKAGNYLHSVEYARRHRDDGIVCVAVNPGNLDSDLYRSVESQNFILKMSLHMFTQIMLHPIVYGAYTELFAGLSPDVTMEKTGSWIGPWGRFFAMRRDIEQGAKPVSEGGLGIATQFWDWSMKQVKPFM